MPPISKTTFEDWEAKQLQDPEFVEALKELEPGYQIARLRILRGMTQAELAEMVGTKQPAIARLESGQFTPSLSFLRRLACALDASVEIKLVPGPCQ
ncbi:MAG TPA: helix-turn-helix transcriptional regulator [Anaerolineales bacterium]|nr:helix-turn-helix transcriptional regulator [Anaerolineales bacterium]